MKKSFSILSLLLVLQLISCFNAHSGVRKNIIQQSSIIDTIPYQKLGNVIGKHIVIKKDVELNGGVCILPKGLMLVFKGGVVKDGTLVGNFSKLQCESSAFERVLIKGTWEVPEIRSDMFVDLSYENALDNVFALASPTINNTIKISEGEYYLAAKAGKETCLTVCSNSCVVIDGTIRLLPNSLKKYNIIKVVGKNVTIGGSGSIVGDGREHLGNDGEWGMGLHLSGASNVVVFGLNIRDCWGDCIYIGRSCENIVIDKCTLDHGRRQGVSITNANGVTIKDCIISNVNGTNPQFAIDIEPNANDVVDRVLIERVRVDNCEGGFLSTKGKKMVDTKKIGRVVIRDCVISSKSKATVRMSDCDSLTIEHCYIVANEGKKAIRALNSKNVMIRGNTIGVSSESSSKLWKKMKGNSISSERFLIEVSDAISSEVNNNEIIGM